MDGEPVAKPHDRSRWPRTRAGYIRERNSAIEKFGPFVRRLRPATLDGLAYCVAEAMKEVAAEARREDALRLDDLGLDSLGRTREPGSSIGR